jgi:hypothetical protein
MALATSMGPRCDTRVATRLASAVAHSESRNRHRSDLDKICHTLTARQDDNLQRGLLGHQRLDTLIL